MNFTRDARRNDGSAEAFAEGERMDDFKVFVGKPGDVLPDVKKYGLLIDDVIFFANDPRLPPEPEPFPNRVIFLAAFDTGEKAKYWPGDFEIVEKDLPPDSYWRVARAEPTQREIELLVAAARQLERALRSGAGAATSSSSDITDNR